MHISKLLLPLCAIWLLSGCMVETQVDAYSAIPADIEPKTVFVAPYEGTNSNDLEWQTNARTFAAVLAEKGFSVVSRQKDARLTAYFGFAVDQGERIQTAYSIPQWGVTGYSGASTYGSVYGSSYSATTILNPTYGITGYDTGVRSDVVFTRSVAIEMLDNSTRQTVFKARAISQGSCNSFAPVAGAIIKAVLSNFPQGKSGSVVLPMENEC